MKISELLQKNYWLRRVTPDNAQHLVSAGAIHYKAPTAPAFGVGFIKLTQDDFLNEINPAAHKINSKFMSQRPIYKLSEEKDKNGKQKWVLDGFDEVETVSLGLQEMIVSKKVGHLTGDKFWVANETNDEEAFEKFRSWADYAGLYDAYTEAVQFCERSGDSAIYFYLNNEKNIEYEVFAYEKGDILYPGKDDNGKFRLCRQYTLNGKDAVDIFYNKYMETWVKADTEEETDVKWFDSIIRAVKRGLGSETKSEDGYTRILRKDSQVGDDIPQIVYFKVPDIATGPVQDSIEAYEKGLSYVAEEVKSSAFPILFVKSEKIVSLPPNDLNHKTIGVKGSSETVKNSDAKFLAPPDASNIANIHLEALFDNILRGSLTALVEPEVMKQGADSSTAIKMLFAPDIIWCKNRWVYYSKPVKLLVEIFKRLVGKAEDNFLRYAEMRISSGQNIYIPQNEAETLKMELDALYARAKSRKAVMEDTNNSHKGDYEQVMKEWQEELEMKAKYSSQGQKQEDTNPSKTPVNNQAAGKSIQQD